MNNKIIHLLNKVWFQLLVIAVVTFIAYSNSFSVPFHFDDEQQIVYNESQHSIQKYENFHSWMHVNRRPVSSFTLAANYVIGGENVLGYHLVNFLIHLLTGVFLFFLLRILLSNVENDLKRKYLPLVISLFFLVQPVQTQAVTYIVQRMTSLSGLFVVMAVFFYTKGRINYLNRNNLRGSIVFIGAALFAGILGILSKQNAVVFPLLFLLVEFLFIRTSKNQLCTKYLIFSTVVLFLFTAVYVFRYGLPYETKDISRGMYLATQMTVIPRYFQMMLIPFGLSIDHGVSVVESIFNTKVILGTLFIIGVLVYGFVKIKSQPLISFGIFWIFITLLVESSIIPIRDVMFDHRMYLPLAGFSLLIWTLGFDVIQLKRPKSLFTIVVFVLFVMAAGTYARNEIWKSEVRIWKKVTEMYPNYFRGWQGLGREYVASGETNISLIIHSYEKAISIDPDNETVLNDLGANYLKINAYEKGVACYEKLINSENKYYQINSLRVVGVYNLSVKKFDAAEDYLKRVLEIDSNDTTALLGLSSLYMQQNEYNRAIYYGLEYDKFAPGNESLLFNLGLAYLSTGDPGKAIFYSNALLKMNSENVNALILHANACVNLKDYSTAIRSLQMAYDVSKNERFIGEIEKVKNMLAK